MEQYDKFVNYYNKIVRPEESDLFDEIEFLEKDIFEEYAPWKIEILEFACWSWVVMKELLERWFDITWVDISKKMLLEAKKILPEERLILWDMTDINLEKKFDIILCNYNSICHLLSFQEWEKFFDIAKKHLKKWWILVFDINTLQEFETLVRDYVWARHFWDDSVILEVFKDKNSWFFYWLVTMFIKNTDWKYEKIEEKVEENSFELDKIKDSLNKKWFMIESIIDYHKIEVDEESERVYFIARNL